MGKYYTGFKLQVIKHVTYRARVIIWFLVDIGQFLILPFLWLAIYAGKSEIQGFTTEDIVTYYILMAFISLSTSCHAGEYIQKDIRKGELNKFITKPLSYSFRMATTGYSYNFVATCFVIPVIILFSILFPEYITFPNSFFTIILFIISLFCAAVISCLFHLIIGFTTFWLEQNGVAMQMRSILEKVFGGELAPLSFYPTFLQHIAFVLPFQYIAFFPAQIYLEKIVPIEIGKHFLFIIGWIVFLTIISLVLWKRGLKRYEAPGS